MPKALGVLLRSFDEKHGARRHVPDAGKARGLPRHVLEREVSIDGLKVDLGSERRERMKRLHLGRESEYIVVEARPNEWLLAKPIAGKQEAFAPRIPKGNREHPVQLVYKRRSVFLVQVRNDSRVAGAPEVMPMQRPPEFAEVVELAIENSVDVAALIRNGLLTVLKVHDA
jgi:hypothetical protein